MVSCTKNNTTPIGNVIQVPIADTKSEVDKVELKVDQQVIITKNDRGDTLVKGLQEYKQMTSELELLRTLAEAEEDVKYFLMNV